jgi:ABC-type sulfate transport system permease component
MDMLVALALFAVGLVVFLARTRKPLLSGAIMAFARSMDITPLYARPRRRTP